MTGRLVKAEYSYTDRLWADPNSPEAISVLAIPGLATCLMRSAGRRGKAAALGRSPRKGLAMPWAVGRPGAFPYTCARRSSSHAAGPGTWRSARDVAQLG
jgi:hypothetical protein